MFGLFVCLPVAALYGNSPFFAMRDLIAFVFLFLPLLYFGKRQAIRPYILPVLLLIGISFSVRTVFPLWDSGVLFHVWSSSPPDLLYLANAPAVFFSALCFWIYSGRDLAMSKSLTGFLFLFLSIICLVSMAVMMQRATLMLALVLIVLSALSLLYRRPVQSWVFLIPVLCIGYIFFPVIETLFSFLVHKTEVVGLNSRTEEIKAVYFALLDKPVSLLFGLGFGAVFENPAVGFLYVNFTHNLFSYIAIKAGFAGCVLCLLYGMAFVPYLLSLFKKDFFIALCLSFPLFINVFFYAGYKSFSFGLLLLLVAYYGEARCLKTRFYASESCIANCK